MDAMREVLEDLEIRRPSDIFSTDNYSGGKTSPWGPPTKLVA